MGERGGVDLTAEIVSWRAPASRTGPALLLDRDGVLNRRIVDGYVLHFQEAELNVPFLEALGARFGGAPVPVAIVSNQSCVGRGLMTRAELSEIMERFVETLARYGLALDAWFCCPHAPSAGCSCRKPQPALVETALHVLAGDPVRSVLIGDSESDLTAARAAHVGHPIGYSMEDGDAASAIAAAASALRVS
jgi:D-glycero-D-manno-heptose 1,7-bisphosphate phosphatase